jgi:hypothetical protein
MDLEALENEVIHLEDIQAIKDVQQKYGFYMDSHHREEVVDLFSEDTESLEIESVGLFLGKDGVKRFFLDNDLLDAMDKTLPKFINIRILMTGGVITVDPSGNTANGRWSTWLVEAMNVGGIPRQQWVHGYYENKYIKEDGMWLFKKFHWNVTFFTSYEAGWIKIPLLGILYRDDADAPAPHFHPYPSGYQVPYHFNNPVTGK